MRRFLPFIVILIVVLLYTKPYFRTGFFATQDGEWSIVRLAEMQREIKDLQVPPRWSDYLNHGYGYPLFSFTYPAPFYIGILFRLVHIGLTDSIKIIFVASVFFSAIFMFLLGRELAGDYAGFLSAVFYTVAPFRLVDLYVRGSIGESLSLAIFPLLFYLSLKYVLKPTSVKMVLCSFVLAFMILAHNIMALVFFPFWIVFLYVSVISYYEDIKLYSWRYFLPMILLGLGLAAYFYIPALLEKNYLILSQIKLADVSQNFIRLPDFLLSPWSWGDKPSFQLGWAHILAGILGFISLMVSSEIDRKKYMPLAIFIISSIAVLIFFAHPFSADFWSAPPLSWLDFPWRLLTPLAFFLAMSSIFLSTHKNTRIIGGILVVVTVIFSLNFAHPDVYINKPDVYYATNDATTTSKDELMPIWVKEKPENRYTGPKAILAKAKSTLYNLQYNSHEISFRTITEQPNTVTINTIYFPGWKFYVGGVEVPIDYRSSPQGLITVNVPVGNKLVEGKFTETPVRFWSDMISLFSLSAAAVLLLRSLVLRLIKRPSA